jgi:hypothetical protein
VMPEDGLAPLFDGAAWAGTQLWEAAVEGINYMEKTYGNELSKGYSLHPGPYTSTLHHTPQPSTSTRNAGRT